MPQHQDQHDVILTEVGRQVGTTGVHVIGVQFITDLVGTGVTATMQFKQSGGVAESGSETTTHLLTVKKGTTTILGSITWQRVIKMLNAADTTGGEVLEPVVRTPADAGADPTPLDATTLVWSPVLESGPVGGASPTWTFALHMTHAQLAVTKKVQTKNVRRWKVEAMDGSTLVYRGYLTATVSTSASEPDPIDPGAAGGGANKLKSKKKAGKKTSASKKAATKAAVPPKRTPIKKKSAKTRRK